MSGIGNRKLRDAIPNQNAEESGKPMPTHETMAEQAREARENDDAQHAQASNRERMVDIGRGNQQAGRQGQ